ncbi:MAG TPA: Hsp70 family protein [Burkholderiaceae bacterium]|nr:Hsp70 family protein [Burkholderiaceae bacterium]
MTGRNHCAIDFGTSNSAVALPSRSGVELVPLEQSFTGMPTAVFYAVEGLAVHQPPQRLYGRAAIAAYVEGGEGRLMRSMKSILGSDLVERSTEVGGGHSVRYLDVIGSYLRHLKASAEARAGSAIERVVLGRPVFFVDDDPARDAAAQGAMARVAREVGFTEVQFQYEPIAAALDHEQSVGREQTVLVADIGGGTSDFSVVRVGPRQRTRLDRRGDILANHGVHVAGTDFDRRIELKCILPLAGYGSLGKPRADGRADGGAPREVPNGIYFDLATWHLINTCYTPARVLELRGMRDWYADERLHARLMTILQQRLGHALAARAEEAKIAVSSAPAAPIELSVVEPGLAVLLREPQAMESIAADRERIVAAARETLVQAGLRPAQLDAMYFTGGSTGLQPLVSAIAGVAPDARIVRGDRFASVATGLGVHARRLFEGAAA